MPLRLLPLGLLGLLTVTLAHAAEYYVAPAGDDSAAGTLEHPFASLQRAQQEVQPGDIVWLRGGTYRLEEKQIAARKGYYAAVILLEKSGTREEPIVYAAWQDEHPVFDATAVRPEGLRVHAVSVSGSCLHLRGFEITGVQVTILTHTQSICVESNGSHNIFENLRLHDGQAIGLYHVHGSDNLFLNCDAWNNWDYTSEDGKGGNADGFGCHPSPGSTGNVFRGCRAWFNSDDGFDCLGSYEPVTFDHCWALYNGLNAKWEHLGDGNGFKAGGYGSMAVERLPRVIPRHVVRYCLAVGNRASGFYSNHHLGGSDWMNNSAYRNGTNFNLLCRLADNHTDTDGYGHRLTNNLSYRSHALVARLAVDRCELSHNTFLPDLALSDRDFVSLDEAALVQPRQAGGELPAIAFLQPAPGSPAAAYGIFAP